MNVCFSLFDGFAFSFLNKFKSYMYELKVVLVASISPEFVMNILLSFLHIDVTSTALLGHIVLSNK